MNTLAFWSGFYEKCAALNVNASALLKIAASKDIAAAPTKEPTITQDYSPDLGSYSYSSLEPAGLEKIYPKLKQHELMNVIDAANYANLATQGSSIDAQGKRGAGSFLGTLLGAGGGGLLGHHLAQGKEPDANTLATLLGATGGAGLGNLLGSGIGGLFQSDNPIEHIHMGGEGLPPEFNPDSKTYAVPFKKYGPSSKKK